MKLRNSCLLFVTAVLWILDSTNLKVIGSKDDKIEMNPKPDWNLMKPKYCFNDPNYKRPNLPISLKVMMFIKSVYDISEDKMEFGLQAEMVEKWVDPYLNITETKIADFEILPSNLVECLWKPDLIFYNAKELILYNHPVPNMYTALRSNGWLFRSSRYRLTISCNMNFHLYPMDHQYCSVEIGLLASTESEVRIDWDTSGVAKTRGGVGIQNKIKPLNFDIEHLDSNVTEMQWAKKKEFLFANFVFTRSLVASIVNTFIPSFLVVCLSFVSFWLDVNAVPGRVTLGVTSILTLATSINIARGSLPTLDYMTAMDVWLLGCMIMVFLSLIEFTMAQSLSRQKNTIIIRDKNITENNVTKMRLRLVKKLQTHYWTNRIRKFTGGTKNCPIRPITSKNVEISQLIPEPLVKTDNFLDRASRIAFPLIFLTFTFTYWVYFLKESNRI